MSYQEHNASFHNNTIEELNMNGKKNNIQDELREFEEIFKGGGLLA